MWGVCNHYIREPENGGGSYRYPASRRPVESRTFTLITLVTLVFIFVTSMNLLSEAKKESVRQTHPKQPVPEERKTREKSNVCRDVFEIRKTTPNMTEWMANAVKVIASKKRKKKFVPSLFYELVGLESPSMVGHVNDSSGFEGSNLTIAKEWRFDQSKGHLPHLSCHLKKFDAREVDRCVRARQSSGKRTWITYVGDSRVRLHVEVLIDLLRDLRPKITTYKGEVISVEDFFGEKGMTQWRKYKHNFRVEVESKGGAEGMGSQLVISFAWAAFIEHSETPEPWDKQGMFVGAKEFLHNLTEVPDEELPDLLILNTGVWHLNGKQARTDVDMVAKASVDVMASVLPVLSHLATRTTVVWSLPDPVKEYINHDDSGKGHFTRQTNTILEWLSNAQTSMQAPGVLVWDSFLPIAYTSVSDCISIYVAGVDMKLLPQYSNFNTFLTWECVERMHIGLEVLSVAVQMMLNHLCNPYLSGQHCCSR